MHQRRQFLAAVITAVLLSVSVHATEPSSAERMAALIAQFGGAKSDDRNAAARALEALGAPALGPLREARQSGDAEVRRRARLLVQAIERRVEAERLLKPSRVRLVYKDTPLREAAADLGRKTGFAVRIEGDTARTVTLDTGDSTIWEAVARFCKEVGTTERPADAGPMDLSQYDPWDRRVIDVDEVRGDAGRLGNQLLLKDGALPSLPAFQNGALRLRALPLETNTEKPAGEPRFGLEVRVEPRLRLQAVLAVRIDRAVDDRGQTLAQPAAGVAAAGALAGGPGEEVLLAWDGESALPADFAGEVPPVSVRLKAAEQPSKRLKEVHGSLALQVLAPPEPLVAVDDLHVAGKTTKGRAGSAVKVVELRREADGPAKLRVEVVPAARDLFFAGMPARLLLINGFRWRGRGQPVPPPVAPGQLVLLDNRGREVPLVSTSVPTVGSGGTAWAFTLTYQPGPGQNAPTRLVYSGRRGVTIEVPFTLKDVPLEPPIK